MSGKGVVNPSAPASLKEVGAHARARWAGGPSDEEGEAAGEEEQCWQASLDSLPLEVMQVVLRHLDPLSLSAVACTSRYGRVLGTASRAGIMP